MENDIKKRLNQLKIEDFIWIIYIGIIILSLYSNTLERKYFVNNDLNSKEKYRNITIFIFTVLVIVYAYFLNDSFNDFINDTNNNDLVTLSFFGSLLIFVSGLIFLYIAIKDENIDVELAFN